MKASTIQVIFLKLSDTQILSYIHVLCPEHSQQDIISNCDEEQDDEPLSLKARMIIAQIKSKTREEIEEEILLELQNKTQDAINTTIRDADVELEITKKENVLLNELVKDLTEKINF